MHIGLIGGIGPAATVYYYQHIAGSFAALSHPLHLTIAHTSVLELSQNASAGRAEKQAREYKRVTDQLAAAGATAVAITSMGGHFCIEEFSAISPLPVINGPQSVADYLKQRGIRQIGILGTRIVMESHLYGSLRELAPVSPTPDKIPQINDDYTGIAIAGSATSSQAKRLISAGEELVRNQGAQAILLGGTDLNLVYDEDTLDVPVIDSAKIHADAIVSSAINNSDMAK